MKKHSANRRAPSPGLGAGRSRTTGQFTSYSKEGKRDPAVPEELGQAKAGRWASYLNREIPSLLCCPALQNKLKTRGQKTPLNQRSTIRQDMVEVLPSDPGLCLQHNILWHLPSAGQTCPRRHNPHLRGALILRVTEPQHIPPGACFHNRHVVPSSCCGPVPGTQESTMKRGEEYAVEEKRIVWNHQQRICNNNTK